MRSEYKTASSTSTPPPFDATNIPKRCIVTGGSGMVGSRLIELLIARGAERVISFDIRPPKPEETPKCDASQFQFVKADITDSEALEAAFQIAADSKKERRIEAVFHIAALVGPFYEHSLYHQVNVVGTRNVIALCKKHQIRVLVDCSSPSTRMSTFDINGMTEKDFEVRNGGNPYPQTALHEYGRTKAVAEQVFDLKLFPECSGNRV